VHEGFGFGVAQPGYMFHGQMAQGKGCCGPRPTGGVCWCVMTVFRATAPGGVRRAATSCRPEASPPPALSGAGRRPTATTATSASVAAPERVRMRDLIRPATPFVAPGPDRLNQVAV
jgi:hypothetical protein